MSLGNALALFYGLLIGIPSFLIFLYMLSCIKVVEKGTAMLVERLGKFHRRCDAGLHLLIPFIDRTRSIPWRYSETYIEYGRPQVRVNEVSVDRIDLRENILDFPSQPIITRDNVEIEVHPMLLYRLVNPIRVAYETYDLCHAVEKLVQTTLRSIIGDMGLDDTLASREEINRALMQKISLICNNWGVEITRVELLEIAPTKSVQNAMHKQLSAERVRRAQIVTADGYREQTKTEAEGACQAQIALATGEKQVTVLRAKGIADSKKLIAEAEAKAVQLISEALQDFDIAPTQYLIGLRYIETLQEIALRASDRVVFFPVETDVVGAIGQLTA